MSVPERESLNSARRDYCYLCCNCGAISSAELWLFLQYDQERDDGTLRLSEQGEGDPVMRCPECGYDHRDDYGPGVYDGTRAECEREREREIAENADEPWSRLPPQGNPVKERVA